MYYMRELVNNRYNEKLKADLESLEAHVKGLGFDISYGIIGTRTTYALLVKNGQEVVGYTYLKGPLNKYNETLGRYKALGQAEARRILIDENDEIAVPDDLPEISNTEG